eukprot:gene59004-80806_t
MQCAAHVALERGIDELVLFHARQTGEGDRDDARLVVVAVAREVIDRDLGVGKRLGQIGMQGFDGHRHGAQNGP